MKTSRKALRKAQETLQKSLRGWRRVLRRALASEDAATAARAQTQCDELEARLATLNAPADAQTLPSQDALNAGITDALQQGPVLSPEHRRRIRASLGFFDKPLPVMVIRPDPQDESMTDDERDAACKLWLRELGARPETSTALAAAVMRVLVLLENETLPPELESTLRRMENEIDTALPMLTEGKERDDGEELVEQMAEAEGIETARDRAAGADAEPETDTRGRERLRSDRSDAEPGEESDSD
jgi:hypothetical protein